ncbi:MAG: serine hydrolase domain-containing protein, partial [Melioribacteraceae bacterium]|nr:serine hydrolase domain-containing protein [Melioribacteraceae bacterium]
GTFEEKQLIAILHNKFTETDMRFQIPISSERKINWLIKNNQIKSSNGDSNKEIDENRIVNRLDFLMDLLEKDEEFSGVVAIEKDDKRMYQRVVGHANKSYNISNKIDTKFNIASVGKIFTGVAITQLVERGLLSFDDTLGKFIGPEWLNPEVSNKILIKHLLTHTSGLGDYFKDAYSQNKEPVFRRHSDYKSLISDDSLNFEPGSNFSYSNTGMLLLGVVIENITKVDYFEFLKQNIFEPAGMLNSYGYFKDRPVSNRATGYTKIYEGNNVNWDNNQFTRIMRGTASGGVYSTAEDLLKFARAIKMNKLLSEKYVDLLYEGRPELKASFHSYAFFLESGNNGKVLSHKGDGRGMNCQFKLYLDSGYTIVVLSNYSAPSANIVANAIEQLMGS